jgi:hypothetical protein
MDKTPLRSAVLRQAAKSRPETGPPTVRATIRMGSSNPMQDLINFEEEAHDAVKALKSEDEPGASKLLQEVLKHTAAMDKPLQAVNAEWKKAVTAFKKFQGEIRDESLEPLFKELVKSMWTSLGFGHGPRL